LYHKKVLKVKQEKATLTIQQAATQEKKKVAKLESGDSSLPVDS
jgi:hypothetical protein